MTDNKLIQRTTSHLTDDQCTGLIVKTHVPGSAMSFHVSHWRLNDLPRAVFVLKPFTDVHGASKTAQINKVIAMERRNLGRRERR